MVKVCSDCLLSKNAQNYTKHKPSKDGLLNICRECVKIRRAIKKAAMVPIWESQTNDIKKLCKLCHKEKSITRFHKCLSNKDGRETSCLDCRNYEISKANLRLMQGMSIDDQKMYKRKLRIYRKYHITPEQFEALLLAQDNSCAICESKFNSADRAFCVDHDHRCCQGESSCGKCVRGLLCDKCNWAIGLLDDSIDNVLKAKEYLLKWNT